MYANNVAAMRPGMPRPAAPPGQVPMRPPYPVGAYYSPWGAYPMTPYPPPYPMPTPPPPMQISDDDAYDDGEAPEPAPEKAPASQRPKKAKSAAAAADPEDEAIDALLEQLRTKLKEQPQLARALKDPKVQLLLESAGDPKAFKQAAMRHLMESQVAQQYQHLPGPARWVMKKLALKVSPDQFDPMVANVFDELNSKVPTTKKKGWLS